MAAQTPLVAVSNLRKDLEAVKARCLRSNKARRIRHTRRTHETDHATKKKLLKEVADTDREIAQAKAEERQ